MHCVRPIRESDLDSFFAMAKASGGGITTLPADQTLLQESIERSLFAFSFEPRRPKGERYLFVLDEIASSRAIGCSGLYSKTGGFDPLCLYRRETRTKTCESAGVHVDHELLVLESIHDGPSELSTLFLLPEARGAKLGKLLSLARLLFVALHRRRFEESIIASMRGVLDAKGSSPLWDALGAHLYGVSFEKANDIRQKDPRFVRDLVPSDPIYLSLLPMSARTVIGKTHPNTAPALALLERQGFRPTSFVDIFDGGPVWQADVKNLLSVTTIASGKVMEILPAREAESSSWILCNGRLDFRACYGEIEIHSSGALSLCEQAAQALEVERGEHIWYIPAEGSQGAVHR